MGYAHRPVARRRAHHVRGLDPARHRSAVDPDGDVQSAAGDRAAAAGAACGSGSARRRSSSSSSIRCCGRSRSTCTRASCRCRRRCAWRAQNFGLKGLRYVVRHLVPAAFPAILAGLKIGWAFAWRTLIAAELVFGVSSGSGRARLVHLREPQHARHRQRVRRPAHRDGGRAVRRRRDLPHHRETKPSAAGAWPAECPPSMPNIWKASSRISLSPPAVHGGGRADRQVSRFREPVRSRQSRRAARAAIREQKKAGDVHPNGTVEVLVDTPVIAVSTASTASARP